MVRYVRYEGHQDVRRRHAPGKQHEHQLNLAPTRLGHYCIDSEDSNGGFRQTCCQTSNKRAALHLCILPRATSAVFCATCC